MNRERRERLSSIIQTLENCQADIDGMKDEEQEVFDNMPENLQGSERGESISEAIDNLDSATYSLSECIDSLNEILA